MRKLLIAALCLALLPGAAHAAHKAKSKTVATKPAATHAKSAAPAKPVKQAFMAANVDDVRGTVTGRHAGLTTAVPLGVNYPIFVGDTIETGDDGRVALTFADGAQIGLGPKGKLVIDEYVYDPAKPDTGKVRLGILDTVFELIDGDLGKAKNADVQLNLNYGSIGIRGTHILRGIKDGECWVYVMDGSVDVFNDAGHIHLAAGEGTKMKDKKIAPIAAQHWSDADIKWIRDTLRPNGDVQKPNQQREQAPGVAPPPVTPKPSTP
ncbi:MAG TPA: FecR domain-containing protein [Patescibacteria group bacterium]|nr:FecR domain-containing protein [Patescibacteria group bacterium]